MKISVCTYTHIPVRTTPSECDEMSTQLIFGDAYEVIPDEAPDRWLKIRRLCDSYTGYIDYKLWQQNVSFESQDEIPYMLDESGNRLRILTRFAIVKINDGNTMMVSMGSLMPTQLGDYTYTYDLEANQPQPQPQPIYYAQQMLCTPYLWGGLTFGGIDCSGLCQTSYSCCNVQLLRDASQIITMGKEIDFADRQPNDLAFFCNAKGRITHIGMVWHETDKIIHASGSVRIDTLTKEGIIRTDGGRTWQSHTLHSIRRISGVD